MPARVKRGLPSRDEILAFVAGSATPVGKREIASAFKVAPADRVALKGLIKEIERTGAVERGGKRRLAAVDALPSVGVVEVVAIDGDGEVTARPVAWRDAAPPPRIVMRENRLGADTIGDRVLARLERAADGAYEAHAIRRLQGEADRVLGVYRQLENAGRIEPTDRRVRTEYHVASADANGAVAGELVLAEVVSTERTGAPRGMGLPRARVLERLGDTAN